MKIGDQIYAKDGFRCMSSDRVYHYLHRDYLLDRALILWFDGKNPILDFLSLDDFELGLGSTHIAVCETQRTLPIWLGHIEGKSESYLHGQDVSRGVKNPKVEKARTKAARIEILLRHEEAIFGSECPQKALGEFCKQYQELRSIKVTRIRWEFWVYVAFGRRSLSLYPDYSQVGKWPRSEFKGVKLGRPSCIRGKGSGYPLNEKEKKLCVYGYERFIGEGKTLAGAWRITLERLFGCKQREGWGSYDRFFHPTGKHFPSYDQFRGAIDSEYSTTRVKEKRLGSVTFREKRRESRGPFNEMLLELMARAEIDGAYSKEHPSGLTKDDILPKLCIVRLRDSITGMLVGLGVSVGPESGDTYRSALFCAAIDKVNYCRLFGIEIGYEEWPCTGVMRHLVTDKGPGDSVSIDLIDLEKISVIDSAISNSGQSKAIVEAGHAKVRKIGGAKSYVVSRLNVVEMVKKEIYEVLKFNRTANVSSRLSPSMREAGVKPYPIDIWNYLDSRGRNAAKAMEFHEAVRLYLKPVELRIEKDGLYLEKRRYDSDELRDTGILEQSRVDPSRSVKGYVLPICVRHIWAEIGGELIELDLRIQIPGSSSDFDISLEDLIQESEIASIERACHMEHRQAVIAQLDNRLSEEQGISAKPGHQRKGRAKLNTKQAKADSRIVRGLLDS